VIIKQKDYLEHYGILRKSGRYPWGSGGDIPQRSRSFLDYVQMLKNYGLSEAEVAKGCGMTTTELRAAKTIAKNQDKQANIAYATRLKEKQYSTMAISRKMGIPESSVRNLLKPGEKEKADELMVLASMLKEEVATKQYVDVGKGVERHLGISREKLDTALAVLKEDGEYAVHKIQENQLGTQNKTTIKVLAPPGTTYRDIVTNRDKIQQIQAYSSDNGRSYDAIQKPLSINSKRLAINYAEDGGSKADGVIYVRPGVDDVSLGKARYAQVRIAIDDSHYVKGMAMYKSDLPDGVDLVFNTNKSNTGNKLDALKPLKTDDPDNPFGSVIHQIGVSDGKGNKRITSAMNLVNEEGDWDKWSKSLSSQMLSKQKPKLAEEQLNMTYKRRRDELDEIKALTNPAVKKKLLEEYADSSDSAAVHLKAANLPRQRAQVILPVNSLKETEVYAPNFAHGERVVLIRHPHGGIFEIPELIVNNNHRESKSLLGQAQDAIAINSKVAAKLSGADFDGDTVLVIPNNSGRVITKPSLEGLKNFEPQKAYPAYEGMPKMSARTKQTEMGLISNLITDMTIKGANDQEIAQAVRHSMVVIDAEKHNLNYRESARVNNIQHLREKYQGKKTGSASTLISRAGSRIDVDSRKLRPASQGGPVDPKTGKLVYVPKDPPYVNKQGKLVTPKMRSQKLAETDDAFTLVSQPGTRIEKLYAEHSNKLKGLANEARKEALPIKASKVSLSAKAAYKSEVETLKAKLNIALMNAPLERQAQIIANAASSARKAANPDMDRAEIKKLEFLELEKARIRTGAKKHQVEITPREWEAIQANAVSGKMLTDILNNADMDVVRSLATPKAQTLMTSAKTQRAQSMIASGYSQADVADALGVSLTTLKMTLSGGA
jgi:hypothetical protein